MELFIFIDQNGLPIPITTAWQPGTLFNRRRMEASIPVATSSPVHFEGPRSFPSVEYGKSQASRAPSPSSDTSGGGDRLKWSDDETKILLQVWSEHHAELKKKRNKAVWDIITQNLNEMCTDLAGFTPRTANQVKAKIKNLTDAYKEEKNLKNSKTGNGREISPYYDLIDEVIGTRKATCPSHVLEVSAILSQPDNHSSEGTASASQVESDINKSETASSVNFREDDLSEDESRDEEFGRS